MEGIKILKSKEDTTSPEDNGDSETSEESPKQDEQQTEWYEKPAELAEEEEESLGDGDTINLILPGKKMETDLAKLYTPPAMEEREAEEGTDKFADDNTSKSNSKNSLEREMDGTKGEVNKKDNLLRVKSQSCSMCGKMFLRLGDRKRHEASCLRSPYRCHYCIKCFSSEDEWYEHEKRHTDGPIYKCSVCGMTSINQRTWRQHMRLKHPSELKAMDMTASVMKCQHCEETFNSYRSLGDHMKSGHPDTLAKALSHHCQFCQRSFSSSFGLRTHQIALHPEERAKGEDNSIVKKIRRKYQCDQCGKLTRNGKTHSRMHTGERPFPCKVCEKPFTSYQNLKQHMRTHTGEKPYKCRFCTSSFTTSGSRIRHERIHTGDKPFVCTFCEKAFKSNGQLSVHERSHTGFTPYQCAHCDKKFSYKSTFDRHLKTHKTQK